MGFLGGLGAGIFKTGGEAAYGLGQVAYALGSRMPMAGGGVAGALIGGMYGYGTSDANTATGNMSYATGGAIYGALAGSVLGGGAALARAGFRAGKNIYKDPTGVINTFNKYDTKVSGWLNRKADYLENNAESLATRGYEFGVRQLNRAIGAGEYIINHPVASAAMAGGGIAGVMAMNETFSDAPSPTLSGARVDMNYDRQALAAEEMNMGGASPSGSVGTFQQFSGGRMGRLQQSTYGLVQGMHRGRHGGR